MAKRRSGTLSITENPSHPEENVDELKLVMKKRKVPDEDDEPIGKYENRTIIIENCAGYSLENLQKLCARYGRVLRVRIVDPHDTNLAGSSNDVLLTRQGFSSAGRTMLSLYAIVEYHNTSDANKAILNLRLLERIPYEENGFRVGFRCHYSYIGLDDKQGSEDEEEFESEEESDDEEEESEDGQESEDEITSPDMEFGMSDELGNTSMTIERLTKNKNP